MADRYAGGDFEHQLPELVGAGGEWRGRRGADVVDGLADYGAHRGFVEELEGAVSERGESAGDQRSVTVSVRSETAIRARWERAVVECGRGGRGAVSRTGRIGPGGDGVVDRGQGMGDVEEAVCLGVGDAELRAGVRLSTAVPQGEPCLGDGRGADSGGADRRGTPDVVDRLAQPPRCAAAGSSTSSASATLRAVAAAVADEGRVTCFHVVGLSTRRCRAGDLPWVRGYVW
ncbi:hypothetical protein GCM10018987_16750 [Streptomyces cremeus]